MSYLQKYGPSFLFGGFLVSLIEYLGNNVDPDYAGIIAAFPIAITSTYFINKSKLNSYFTSYVRSIAILLFITFVYSTLLTMTDLNKNIILLIVLLLWLIINVTYVFLIKK